MPKNLKGPKMSCIEGTAKYFLFVTNFLAAVRKAVYVQLTK